MTVQEAIAFLTETKLGCKYSGDKQLSDICDISIKALEKQIPKTPLKAEKQFIRCVTTYNCPMCRSKYTSSGISSYCGRCGQKLDWSD